MFLTSNGPAPFNPGRGVEFLFSRAGPGGAQGVRPPRAPQDVGAPPQFPGIYMYAYEMKLKRRAENEKAMDRLASSMKLSRRAAHIRG
jgi:hypothetical protein